MGRPLQESLIRVQQDLKFAFTEAPDIGKRFPHLQIRVFLFDHGRRLSHSLEGLLEEIEPQTHPTVRREVASTAAKLLAIENARRKGASEERLNNLKENLQQDQIELADRRGRRVNIDAQWEIASRLVDALANPHSTEGQLLPLSGPLIGASALEGMYR